ncbi:MAG: hypothetical protein ABW051_08950 [Burkholderiaceae bacterium]
MSLLFVVAVIGVLVKKQLSAPGVPPAAIAVPGAPAPDPAAAPKQQVDQVKQAVEAAVQQARPMPEDK